MLSGLILHLDLRTHSSKEVDGHVILPGMGGSLAPTPTPALWSPLTPLGGASYPFSGDESSDFHSAFAGGSVGEVTVFSVMFACSRVVIV